MKAVMIQARMSSRRLPGKVLKEVQGKPLLWYMVKRLEKAERVDKIIILTSKDPSDNPIATFAKEQCIDCFRGERDDVLNRYYKAAKAYNTDTIIRVTGDSPLIDPIVVDRIIQEFEENDYEYVNTSEEWPDGLDTEVFSFATLERMHKKAKAPYQREHVTQYIHANKEFFHLKTIDPEVKYGSERWTVDEPQDFALIQEIITKLGADACMAEILQFLDNNPQLRQLNNTIHRNEGLQFSKEREGVS